MTIEVLNHNLAIEASANGEILPTQGQLEIAKCAELATLIDRHTDSKGDIYYPTAIDSLVFVRCDTCKTLQTVSEPLFAMVAQGEKKLSLNEENFQSGVAQYLVMPVDLLLSVCMVEATPDRPYLGLKLKLDPVQLCEIIAQTNPDNDRQENSVRGWCVSDANP